MNKILSLSICLAFCVGCSGSNATAVKAPQCDAFPSLQGNWTTTQQSPDDTLTLHFSFKDNNFAFYQVEMNTPTTGNVEKVVGTFTEKDGGLKFHPVKGSCETKKYRNIDMDYGFINNNVVLISTATANIRVVREKANFDHSLQFTYGCFEDGKFEATNIVP